MIIRRLYIAWALLAFLQQDDPVVAHLRPLLTEPGRCPDTSHLGTTLGGVAFDIAGPDWAVRTLMGKDPQSVGPTSPARNGL